MKKIFIAIIFAILCFSTTTKISQAVDFCTLEEINLNENNCVKEVRACHILVRTREEAEEIRAQILSGRNFASAASEHSICPSGAQGGDLGYFSRGMMVPEFEQAAFTLPIGEISQPIQTEFGWHLIMVTDKR